MIPVPKIGLRLAIELVGGLIAALAIALLVHELNHWKAKAERYNAEAATDYQAAITASGDPKLARKDTAAQMLLLGSGIADLKQRLATQNAAVQQLADTSKAEQLAAEKAAEGAQERVSEAEAVSQRLRSELSSAAGKSNRTGICEPDEAVKEQWQ